MFNYWILFCFYFKFMKNKDCLARTTKRESLSYVLFIKPCDCRQDETSAVIFCLPRSLILTGNFVVVPSWKLRKKTKTAKTAKATQKCETGQNENRGESGALPFTVGRQQGRIWENRGESREGPGHEKSTFCFFLTAPCLIYKYQLVWNTQCTKFGLILE